MTNPDMIAEKLNAMQVDELRNTLQKCCGASLWVQRMLESAPYTSTEDVLEKSDKAWSFCTEKDWLEAFDHHPKIGDLASLEKKFAVTKELAGGEQAAVHRASPEVLEALANGNNEYEKKFGFIFIVCATGKSAEEMLEMLQKRLGNDRTTELKIAAAEQHKITRLRLNKI